MPENDGRHHDNSITGLIQRQERRVKKYIKKMSWFGETRERKEGSTQRRVE